MSLAPRGSVAETASHESHNVGVALRATRELNFGCAWVNDHLPLLSETPYGGFGLCASEKDLSACALEEYTRIKHVIFNLRA